VSDSSSENPRPELGYQPALDGLRGLAVTAVLLYHGGVSWLGGGFLGVEAFFVLSGFLITALLIVEWRRSATIRLGAFWARRARRLLPALFCLVAVVGIYQTIAGPSKAVPGLEGDGISTLLYFANWHEIWAGSNYFATNGLVSPLQHTWSLAIEEQFYLVWPLALLGLFKLAGRRRPPGLLAQRRTFAVLFLLSLIGAIASAVEMDILYHGGTGLNRVYLGTDTRAQPLLIGAALAFAMAAFRGQPHRNVRKREQVLQVARVLLGVLGAVGAAVLLWAMYAAQGSSDWLFGFGFLGMDVAVAAVIAAAVVLPAAPVARILAVTPLRSVGVISYGLYLWHAPLFLWLDNSSTGLSGVRLLVARLGASFAVALVSFFLVEQPIRQRRLPRWLLRLLTPIGAVVAVMSLVLASTLAPPAGGAQKAPPQAHLPVNWQGTGPTCKVLLNDKQQYVAAPPPADQLLADEIKGLSTHDLDFGGSLYQTFHTCPPKQVLMIGDSVAFTLGIGMLKGEERYGVKLSVAPLLGCGFNIEGKIGLPTGFVPNYEACRTEYQQWLQDERAVHADAVVVEMGWRDSFNWLFNGQVTHLGQPAFDAELLTRMELLVKDLGQGGVPILFITVPWSSPPALPNGSEPPEASAQRHALINAMFVSVARRNPGQVRVLSIDRWVSPGNHFDAYVDGEQCRLSDGLHFTAFCSQLVQPDVLALVRQMIEDRSSHSAHG